MGQAWNVDIRVKSFAPQASARLDFLCVEYGFSGTNPARTFEPYAADADVLVGMHTVTGGRYLGAEDPHRWQN